MGQADGGGTATIAPSCVCASLFAAHDSLPTIPRTPCGADARVQCYQKAPEQGTGTLAVRCLANASWDLASWTSAACRRTSTATLMDAIDAGRLSDIPFAVQVSAGVGVCRWGVGGACR